MTIRNLRLAAAALCAALAWGHASVAQSQAGAPSGKRHGQYFSVNNARIFYQVQGTGPALLLIHGFPLDGALFENQLATLSAKFTVIVPDLPGFGLSTTTNASETDGTYGNDMVALLDHLGVTTAIIGGHSMGGQVTMAMYREVPTRFAGMILFDTNPAAASLVEQAEWPGFAAQATKYGSFTIAPIVVPFMVPGYALMKTPSLGMELTNMISSASAIGVQGGANALVTRSNNYPLLATVTVPALVVEGLEDSLYAYPIAQKTAATIPGAKLTLIKAGAHASMFYPPNTVNTAILSWAKGAGLIN